MSSLDWRRDNYSRSDVIAPANRFIPLDGELTSVKVSDDARYALIKRAPEGGAQCVRTQPRALPVFTPLTGTNMPGDALMGFGIGASSSEIHWP